MAILVNICGIPHEVIECEDLFNVDTHFGQIEYANCVIKINKNLPKAMKTEALCHEIIHGILVHMGYEEKSCDEHFVQVLANAINQTFAVKGMGKDELQEKAEQKP